MNLLDFILLVPVVWICIRGFSKGLIIELASLIGLILGILAAYYFSGYVRDFLKDYFSFKENTLRIIAYIVTFLAVILVVYLIGKIIEKFIDIVAMGWLNKILGAVFGLAKGIVLVSILLFIIEKTDPGEKIIKPQVKEKSMFYQPVMEVVHWAVPKA
ncbi:MAG: CvpA family protein [Bacteroidales bacterium]|nr:CvpA family protein [Bacteroidales bacterium]